MKRSTTHRSIFQGSPQGGNVIHWTPNFSNQTLVGHVETALVQYVVNSLHLLHLDGPGVDRFRSFNQNLLQVVLRPMENLGMVETCDYSVKKTDETQKTNMSNELPNRKGSDSDQNVKEILRKWQIYRLNVSTFRRYIWLYFSFFKKVILCDFEKNVFNQIHWNNGYNYWCSFDTVRTKNED